MTSKDLQWPPVTNWLTFWLRWPHSGYITATFWLPSGYILATFWLHSGYILTTFWVLSGFILANFRLHSGYILTTLWLHYGYILATFWLHSGYILTTIWLHSDYKNRQKRQKDHLTWLDELNRPHIDPSQPPMQCPAGTRTWPATRYFFWYLTRPDSVSEIIG